MPKLDSIKIKDNNTYKTLLDIVYPIGSVYFSADGSNPASLFGGTWIKYGGGLIAANDSDGYYAAIGASGGSLKLTTAQMPSHNHSVDITTTTNGSHRHTYSAEGNGETWGAMLYNKTSTGVGRTTVTYNSGGTVKFGFFGTAQSDFAFGGNLIQAAGNHSHTVSGNTDFSGSGNNFIPYHHSFAVYKRIA